MRSRIALTGILCLVSGILFAQKMTVKDSDTNVLMEVNDEGTVGSITVPSGSAPSVTTNKLYNVSGSLFWNGTALGTAGSAGGWTDVGANVYTTTSTDKVGIGTSSPEFKLSLDDDGGIIAIGTLGSGTDLSTAGGGTRLIWYPKKAAFRAGFVAGTEWDDANIGNSSTAIGYKNKASGYYSTSMGLSTTASGNASTSMGSDTKAESYGSMAIGQYNVGGGTADTWQTGDPLFEIGNGSGSEARNNALTVLKNGKVGIGIATPSELLQVNGKTLTSQLQVGTSATAGHVLTADASGNATWQAAGGGGGGWTDGGANVYTTTSTDKVGIGTTTPEFKLSLDDDGGIIAKGSYGTGLDLSTSGGGTRLIWYPKKAAFRAGGVDGTQWNDANVGDYSVAMGIGTKASGYGSTAMGTAAEASSYVSTAMGNATTASGENSTAMGIVTTASGNASTAMGDNTKAESLSSTAIGQYNIGGGTANTWQTGDPLFEIGNGADKDNRANALTVLKNGKVGIGIATPSELLQVNGKTLTSQLQVGTSATAGHVLTADASGNATWQAAGGGGGGGWTDGGADVYTTTSTDKVGIGTTTPEFKLSLDDDGGIIAKGSYGTGLDLNTTGTGTRLIWYPKKAAFRAGSVASTQWNDANIGNRSVAMGSNSIASGAFSTALGTNTTASGNESTAMGNSTTASSNFSTAMGMGTIASNYGSTSMGLYTTASGNASTSMGRYTKAESYGSIAIGQFNIGGGTADTWQTGDPLFEIGIGADNDNRANAMTVLKNGNVGIGIATPGEKLQVNGKTLTSQLQVGTSATAGHVLTADASGNATWQEASGGGGGGWTAGSAIVYTTTSTDKVGIGTSSPEFKLSLDDDGGILAKGTTGSGADLSTTGLGTRLIWYPKKAAFRAGSVAGSEWDDTNVGDYSVAMGWGTTAGGNGSTAMGNATVASGENSTAMGSYTNAESYGSMAIGQYNVGGGTAGSWIATDPLFEIGIGYSGTPANAVTVLKNGNVGLGTSSPEFKLSLDDDGGILAKGTTGTGADLSTTGLGTRLIWYPKKAAFRAGYVGGTQWNDANVGDYSVAMGWSTTASGENSTAMGAGTAASSKESTAMGYYTTASGNDATAMGNNTTASGSNSTAMGYSTKAESQNSTAIGRYNVGGGTADNWQDGDPLFEIGIGADNDNRANAVTVLKNGNVGIGTATPQGTLDVNGAIYQRGGVLHADYVFEEDYRLESIEEHADYMWRNKHLKAIPKMAVDEEGKQIVEVGAHQKGIVEELEKAHIYIQQLYQEIQLLKERNQNLEKMIVKIK